MVERAPFEEAGGNSRFTAGAIRCVDDGLDDLCALISPTRRSPGRNSAPTVKRGISTTWAVSLNTAVIRI